MASTNHYGRPFAPALSGWVTVRFLLTIGSRVPPPKTKRGPVGYTDKWLDYFLARESINCDDATYRVESKVAYWDAVRYGRCEMASPDSSATNGPR
jgi:hypothetical protein